MPILRFSSYDDAAFNVAEDGQASILRGHSLLPKDCKHSCFFGTADLSLGGVPLGRRTQHADFLTRSASSHTPADDAAIKNIQAYDKLQSQLNGGHAKLPASDQEEEALAKLNDPDFQEQIDNDDAPDDSDDVEELQRLIWQRQRNEDDILRFLDKHRDLDLRDDAHRHHVPHSDTGDESQAQHDRGHQASHQAHLDHGHQATAHKPTPESHRAEEQQAESWFSWLFGYHKLAAAQEASQTQPTQQDQPHAQPTEATQSFVPPHDLAQQTQLAQSADNPGDDPHHEDKATLDHGNPEASQGHKADMNDGQFQERPNSDKEAICAQRKSILDCDDIVAECKWKGDQKSGGCHYRETEHWPQGVALLVCLSEVFILEGLVVATALFFRSNGRYFLRKLGFVRPDYYARASVWFYPTLQMYAMTGVYYYMRTQDWSLLDTFYFLSGVLSTVGVGNLTPAHPLPKLFTVFHIFVGLVLVGGAVGDEVDRICESRVSRMADAITRAAEFQDLVPALWRVAGEVRSAAGNRSRMRDLIRRLEETPAIPRDRPLIRDLGWLQDLRGGDVVYAEIRPGAGALIPWPEQGAGLWAGAGWRLQALLPLLQYVLENPDGGMPSFDEERTLSILGEDTMMDSYYEDLLYRSLSDVGIVLASGTIFFGILDKYARGKAAFSLFDGFYFSVAGASSVGAFGDLAASTPFEKVFCMGLFVCGCYSFNRFLVFGSEVFAYKIENSQALLATLPEGFSRSLNKLRKGALRAEEEAQRYADLERGLRGTGAQAPSAAAAPSDTTRSQPRNDPSASAARDVQVL
eukprot:TRINITY_DN26805_c0_g1_i1.p1 TRINITY_DN26805_c0_g1~~TRINITY_DN26805_c0_g1_i1.p1  ORF type:complete len:805 (+),score=138.16 TRINITY_DN26805_c0_g1_i1:143-2557(+)